MHQNQHRNSDRILVKLCNKGEVTLVMHVKKKRLKPFVYSNLEFVETTQTKNSLGIQIQNIKMVFNIYGTWRWVTFEKLMMKIYDFFLIG